MAAKRGGWVPLGYRTAAGRPGTLQQGDHFHTQAQDAEVHPGLEGQKWQDHSERTCSL